MDDERVSIRNSEPIFSVADVAVTVDNVKDG